MANEKKSNWGGAAGLTALLVTGAVVAVLFATFVFGRVAGDEFNPQTFVRRGFAFYEIPLIRLQVTPIAHHDESGSVETLIKANKYVTPLANVPEQWHLITLKRSSSAAVPTDARILKRYLDALDSSRSQYWHEWSTKHPKLAAILWPEVARLSRLECYILLPPVFELAEQAEEAQSQVFQTEVTKYVAKALQASAQRLQKHADDLPAGKEKTSVEQRVKDLQAAADDALKPVAESPAKKEEQKDEPK